MKIPLRFSMGGLFHRAADADLSIELDPIECQGRVRIRFELTAFLTLVIGKKYETVVIKFF